MLRIGEGGGGGKGVSRVSVESFCVTVPKNVRRGTLLCFTKSRVSQRYMDRKTRTRGRDFLSNLFCLTVPEHFVGDRCSVSLVPCIEKKILQRVLSGISL